MGGIFFDLADLLIVYEGEYHVKQGTLATIKGEADRQSQDRGGSGNGLQTLDEEQETQKAGGLTLTKVLAFLDKLQTAKGVSKETLAVVPVVIDAVKAGWRTLTGDRDVDDPSAAENALRELQTNFDAALDRRLQEIGSAVSDLTGRMSAADRDIVGSYLHREVRLAREETAKMLGDKAKNLAARGTGVQDILRACWPPVRK